MPVAYGYVSVPSHLHPDDGEAAALAWAHQLADLAAREGYAYAGGFADLRGQSETGLYRLLEVLRRGDGVAVLVPDLDHLRHAGCLAGADLRTAARYLRARLLPLTPGPDAVQSAPPPGPAPDRYTRSARSVHAARAARAVRS
jgi:hypothetical protein